MNILVQFWDQERGKFATEIPGSLVVNIAEAENLFNAVDTVLEEYELQWDQVTSVLMDNCSVMRGAKGGVEARIKENPPPIDGHFRRYGAYDQQQRQCHV